MKTFGMRHVQIILLAVANILNFGMRSCMAIAIVAMTDIHTHEPDIPVLNWDSSRNGLILSSMIWGTMASLIPFGLLLMRCNNRNLVVICVLICGLINFFIPVLATKVGWISILCCSAVIGFALSSVDVSLFTFMSRWAPIQERAQLGAIVMSGISIGPVFTMLTSGYLADTKYGWPSIFYMFGALGTSWAVVFYFFGANSPSEHPTISLEEKHYIESNVGISKKKNLKFPWIAVLKSGPVWALILCNCGNVWCYYALLFQLPKYMKSFRKFNIEKIGGMIALPYFCYWLVTLTSGWLSDWALQFGAPLRMVRRIGNTVGMWGPAAALITLCLIDSSHEAVLMTILVAVIGLNGAVNSGYVINTMDLSPNFCGTLFSIVMTAAEAVGITAPIFCGRFLSNTATSSRWHSLFYITAASYFVSNIIFISLGACEQQSWNEPAPSPTLVPADETVADEVPQQQTNLNLPKQQTNLDSPKQQTNLDSPKPHTNLDLLKQRTKNAPRNSPK